MDDAGADSGAGGREGTRELGPVVAAHVSGGTKERNQSVRKESCRTGGGAVRERMEQGEFEEGIYCNDDMACIGSCRFGFDEEIKGPDATRPWRKGDELVSPERCGAALF